MLSAYWGFVFMSLHLGLHWGMMMGAAKKAAGGILRVPAAVWRILSLMIAGYGMYAFIKRHIGSYIFLKIQFVFFDFEEPLIWFILDYAAVMGLFVLIGYELTKGLRRDSQRKFDNKY